MFKFKIAGVAENNSKVKTQNSKPIQAVHITPLPTGEGSGVGLFIVLTLFPPLPDPYGT